MREEIALTEVTLWTVWNTNHAHFLWFILQHPYILIQLKRIFNRLFLCLR